MGDAASYITCATRSGSVRLQLGLVVFAGPCGPFQRPSRHERELRVRRSRWSAARNCSRGVSQAQAPPRGLARAGRPEARTSLLIRPSSSLNAQPVIRPGAERLSACGTPWICPSSQGRDWLGSSATSSIWSMDGDGAGACFNRFEKAEFKTLNAFRLNRQDQKITPETFKVIGDFFLFDFNNGLRPTDRQKRGLPEQEVPLGVSQDSFVINETRHGSGTAPDKNAARV
ncbi:hypothetical protein SKAU_G00208090 [Synaphobranchus kaupii]|uniref:Uncharacterized protein n=1 Tax=Synaphobranchus kaupii TaxID=118154 RepID=A0A9Q1F8J9_SYNKA|nr:hypothetical protein SKAU_G00208090 [Synaphobranchus kaupii]